MLLTKPESINMTDNEHKNERFRAWATQKEVSLDVSFKKDSPHYNSKETRVAWFEYMGDWHK